MNVEISVRERFHDQSNGWEKYITWIGLPKLTKIRTMDPALNPYAKDCGDYPVVLDEVPDMLGKLPKPKEEEYIQLKTDISESLKIPDLPEFKFLGLDLADETHTSSILNCGPWEGELQKFVPCLNEYGLLDLESAMRVKDILPNEWDDDPHSYVDIWAVYEKE